MPRTREHGTKRHQRRRRQQLLEEPFCRKCRKRGKLVPATVADHIEPHRGDLDKFWNGELQSLCTHCHSSVKQAEEHRGREFETDSDGVLSESLFGE